MSLAGILYPEQLSVLSEVLESHCNVAHLEFHLWYLKAKGWIAKTENGTFAITIEGVDRANSERRGEITTRLLTNVGLN